MAAELGVSPRYVTLIEADQRPASARFLMKLAEIYDLNIAELRAEVPRAEIEAVQQASPRIARAFLCLHDHHREAPLRPLADDNPMTDRDKVEALAETSRPVDAVRGWFYARRNHVDALDRAAEALAEELALHRDEPHMALTARVAAHGIAVRILPAPVLGEQLRRFDLHRRELLLSELLTQSSRRFQIGVLLARLEQEPLIARLVAEAGLADEAAALMRVSLVNYFAAALMMPYGRFLAACESARYDVELLGHRFGASFEQYAHRMSTLQREGARGIPFLFVRVDRAGNISKRFSAGRFPFSRFGGPAPCGTSTPPSRCLSGSRPR